MRHGNKINHLGRTAAHRSAMLSNMASSLILHKRISTTVAKAKALRKYVEPILTKSKEDTTHNRRVVFSYLQNKESVKVLFDEVSSKIASRPGGYTRIIKLNNRLGDNAEMAIIELVDYNELMLGETGKEAKKSRRSRRAGTAKAAKAETVAPAVEAVAEQAVEVKSEESASAEDIAPATDADETKEEGK
jgi:large subunit ribosomal protein L17